MTTDQFRKWVTYMGGAETAAHTLGVDPSTVHRWLKGKRKIPLIVCRFIGLQASKGYFLAPSHEAR